MHLKSEIHNAVCDVGALVAAILILPPLAFADHDNEKGNKDDKGDKDIVEIPEANAAWALVPFFGAVLLYSWRQLSRAKA